MEVGWITSREAGHEEREGMEKRVIRVMGLLDAHIVRKERT